jgi:BirA family biotin operon repressor/biotin-[acetyl-CoA-carboxylase] ligase
VTSDADTRREQVLAALVDGGATGVSGQALADTLGCSRAAIHRHVETLRRSGLAIDGLHEGYRLGGDVDVVVPLLVTPQLSPPLAGPVHWVAETGSTNDDAVAEARAGAPEGLVIGADVQHSGRGRRGRDWRADPGDALLVSVVLRPPVAPADAGLLPIVVATAVATALGPDAGIVWPNDIVIGDHKVCGILCELASDETGVSWAVVGIGVNVRAAPALTGGRWTPGALADHGPPPRRADLLVAILNALGAAYRTWLTDGPRSTLAEFAIRDLLTGRGVTVQSGSTCTVGTAHGLDEAGRLRVLTGAGEVALGAGEVTRIERG